MVHGNTKARYADEAHEVLALGELVVERVVGVGVCMDAGA